jgi:putative membrane protein
MITKDKKHYIYIGLIFLICIFIWSLIRPKSYLIWILESAPLIIGIPVLLLTYKKFKFSNITYMMILIASCVMLIGGHYSYTEVPFFSWIQKIFNLSRNHYDRVGHFIQGATATLIIREVLWKLRIVKQKIWLVIISVCMCLAVSAFYEIIEFAITCVAGGEADAFLGMQGDIWDAQWDMICALVGAIVFNFIFSALGYDEKQG